MCQVNEAYSVLGKEKERKLYDFQVGVRTDPSQFQHGPRGQRQGAGDTDGGQFNYRGMNFEERAKKYGFQPQVQSREILLL